MSDFNNRLSVSHEELLSQIDDVNDEVKACIDHFFFELRSIYGKLPKDFCNEEFFKHVLGEENQAALEHAFLIVTDELHPVLKNCNFTE